MKKIFYTLIIIFISVLCIGDLAFCQLQIATEAKTEQKTETSIDIETNLLSYNHSDLSMYFIQNNFHIFDALQKCTYYEIYINTSISERSPPSFLI